MILEMRTYTFLPGKQGAWLAMYEKHAYPIQLRHLGKPVMFATSEVGPLNQAIHVWAYEDMAEYERKRHALSEDPAWREYVKLSVEAGNTQNQGNRLLRSSSFSPV